MRGAARVVKLSRAARARATAAPARAVRLGDVVVPPVSVLGEADVSRTHAPDRSALSLLFRSLRAELQQPADGRSRVGLAVFEVPVKAMAVARSFTYRCMIRGQVTKTANARACLLVLFGCEPHVIEYPYGQPIDARAIARTITWGGRQLAAVGAALPTVALTVIVAAERRTEAEAVLLDIDSVDLTGHTEAGGSR
jgi:hypothetical protein